MLVLILTVKNILRHISVDSQTFRLRDLSSKKKFIACKILTFTRALGKKKGVFHCKFDIRCEVSLHDNKFNVKNLCARRALTRL